MENKNIQFGMLVKINKPTSHKWGEPLWARNMDIYDQTTLRLNSKMMSPVGWFVIDGWTFSTNWLTKV